MPEPICIVEVVAPEECLGDVMGSLVRRRGRPERQEPRGDAWAIIGRVPVSEMDDYADDLRSITQGRATYTMRVDS